MNGPGSTLKMLVNALRLLASSADVQERAFPGFVVVPDELALNFDDAFRLTEQLVGSGRLSREQVEALARVDNALDELTNRGGMWTLEALRESQEWQGVRAEARKALDALGAGPGTGSTAGISYTGDTPP